MNKQLLKIVFMLLCVPFSGLSQDGDAQQSEDGHLFITTNVNVYQPLGTEQKTRFPILWYDKATKPSIQMGGFGVGLAYSKSLQQKNYVKLAANVSKHTYWDEPISMKDENAYPIGVLHRWGSDFKLSILGTIHHKVSKSVSFGTGLGLHGNLFSTTAVPHFEQSQTNVFIIEVKTEAAKNGYYKQLMPIIPVEINLLKKKATYTIRYEQALLNKYSSSLSNYFNESYGVFYLEGAWKIR